MQEFKIERIEEAKGEVKARFTAKEAEAEAATARVNELEKEVESL